MSDETFSTAGDRVFSSEDKAKLTTLINEGITVMQEVDDLTEGLNDTVKAIAEEIPETQKQNAPAASVVVQEAIPLQHTNDPPSYPRAARRRGMEGLVEINALVDKQGKVKEQQLYQSSGYTILDRAALKAVRKWRFDPGIKNGTICEMWVKVPVRFQLITK